MGGWVHTAEFHKYLTSSTFESLFSLTFLCNNFPRLESLELRCLFCCLVQLFFHMSYYTRSLAVLKGLMSKHLGSNTFETPL